MAGYTRTDTTNNIADGNIINAADLDNEFDGIQAAFNSSTGHNHDGTTGEGAPILVLGPTQDVVVGASTVTPKTTNTVDIGSSSLKFKDLWLAGNANFAGTTTLGGALTYGGVTLSNAVTGTGNMVLSASPTLTGTISGANASLSGTLAVTGVATLTAQPILSSLTASRAVFTDGSKGLVSNAITGTGNVVMSAAPTLTGTITAEALTLSGATTLSGGTANGVAYLNGSKVLTTGSALTFDGTNLALGGYGRTTGTGWQVLNNGLLTTYGANASGTLINNLDGGPIQFQISSTEQMRLTSTGLGIGTSSPAYKLDVAGTINSGASSATGYNLVFRTSGITTGRVQTGLTNTSGDLYTGVEGSTAGQTLTGSAAYSSFIGTFAANPLYLVSNATIRATLDSSGNLGIGTSSPAQKLDVNGSIVVDTKAGGLNPTVFFDHDNFASGTRNYVQYSRSNESFIVGVANADRMIIDSSGNLGLGVTPSAWGSGYKAMQIAGYVAFAQRPAGSGDLILSWNAFNTSGNTSGSGYVYKNTGDVASSYEQNGAHRWYVAPSGTAGNAISFTQAMTLDASGNLGVGTTTPSNRLSVVGASGLGIQFLESSSGNTTRIQLGTGSGVGYINADAGSGSIALALNVAGTERARIDSSGNLLVGTTSQPIGGITTRLAVVQSVADYSQVLNNTNATPYGIYIKHNTDSNGTGNAFIVALGNAADRFVVRSNGGIANYSANDVNLSDRREKTNFAPAKSYLETICAIPVQTFNYIDQNMEEDPGLTLGVVAQDVQAVAPELVMESNWAAKDEEPKMRLSVYQTDLQYALMKALQELKAEFDAYKASHP